MCLTVLHHWPKIAWKPITVYKRLKEGRNEVVTPFQEAKVHSKQLMWTVKFPLYTKRNVYNGIHAYTNLSIAESNMYYDEFIVKATIPRFSLYYLGTYNEICSSRLQLPKF